MASPIDMGTSSISLEISKDPASSQSSQLKDVTPVVLGTYQTGAWGWPPWHTVLCRANRPVWCSAVPGSGHGAGDGRAVMRVEGGWEQAEGFKR